MGLQIFSNDDGSKTTCPDSIFQVCSNTGGGRAEYPKDTCIYICQPFMNVRRHSHNTRLCTRVKKTDVFLYHHPRHRRHHGKTHQEKLRIQMYKHDVISFSFQLRIIRKEPAAAMSSERGDSGQ